jgi:hypothetical protein
MNLIKKLLEDIDPVVEARIVTSMRIAAKIDDEIKAKGWSTIDFHRACNNSIPKGESNYGPRRIERWLSGTHDFKMSELLVIEKALSTDLFLIK